MKRCALVTNVAMAMSWPTVADEKQSEPSSGSSLQSYAPSLTVIMQLTSTESF